MKMSAFGVCLYAALVGSCAQREVRVSTTTSVPQPSAVAEVAAPTLSALVEGVWMHRSSMRVEGELVAANGLLIVRTPSEALSATGTTPAVLIDTTWSAGQATAVYEQAKALGMTITAAVVTHAHADRVAGSAVLEREHGVQTYGLALTQSEARAHNLPVPVHTLPEAGSLVLAGVPIEFFYPGPGHARDNLVVYLPAQHLLFGGCMVRARDAGLGPHGEADLSNWRAAIVRVIDRFPDATHVVPGHGEPGGRELLHHTLTLVDTELAEVSGRFGGG